MMRWQDHLTDTEDHFGEADDVAADSATTTTLEVPSPSGSLSPGEHGDLHVTGDAAVEDTSILPGDIVYISRQTEERLLYTKAVYLGSNGQKPIAREWNSKQEVEVSMPALVRKPSFTEEERLEAEYLWATSALEGREGQVRPRHYRRNILLSSRTIDELKTRAHLLETGEVELQEYDEGLVKPIFSKFLQQINTRDSAHGLPLEDVVRVFYATTTSYFSEDNASTDQIWKADVERSAALLMDVLIGIIREGSDHSDEELAQIKAEHGQMIARASQAVKGARGDYIKQSVGDLQDALDHLEIDFETLEAFKVRAQGVATGQEQLPGFDDKNVRQTFVEFSQKLATAPPRARHLVSEIMQEYESCVLSQLIQLGRLDIGSTAATQVLLRQKALLLSLLISVDAQLQLQHHGSAPRIRSRFTSLLMEERATYMLAISKVQNESKNQSSSPEASTATDPWPTQLPSSTPSNSIRDDDISDIAPRTESSAIERPPRVMRCYQCQHSWTSTIASDLRDCPECGSYSVFAESPRRTASPDNVESPNRPKAHGEQAMGQYFSERTDKFMSLYRDKQPLPGSKQGSQENFPDPWSHLHGSHSSTGSRITQEPPAADLHAIMCYRCGYRFSRPSGLETVDCPKCSTKETFVDFFPAELDGSNLNQPEGTDTSTQAAHNAPPQLIRLVNDIEDLAADLQQLEDRNSSIVADVPVAVEQLLLISAAFKLLIKLERDPDHYIRYQDIQERLQILCSSIEYTLEAASKALRRPLDEMQWTLLCHKLKSDESVEFLQRLRMYQKSISVLNGHVDGSTRMVSPDYDAVSIEVLLWHQRTIRGHQPWQVASKPETTSDASATKPLEQSTASEAESADPAELSHQHDIKQRLTTPIDNTDTELCPEPTGPSVTAPGSISCYYCHASISDVHKDATCPNCGSKPTAPPIPEIPLERMETKETESTQTSQKAYISQLLSGLITHASDATARLHTLNEQYPHNSTRTGRIEGQLSGLCAGFRRLAKHREDARNDQEFDKMQAVVQEICHSAQYTLDDILGVFDTGSDATRWKSWTQLTTRMNHLEKAGLNERLKWYLNSTLDLLHHLEGNTRSVRLGQWMGADEKIAALLERQERFRKTSPARHE
jgi:Zn finger protein HypA/HybF involved in hydrogenase expression